MNSRGCTPRPPHFARDRAALEVSPILTQRGLASTDNLPYCAESFRVRRRSSGLVRQRRDAGGARTPGRPGSKRARANAASIFRATHRHPAVDTKPAHGRAGNRSPSRRRSIPADVSPRRRRETVTDSDDSLAVPPTGARVARVPLPRHRSNARRALGRGRGSADGHCGAFITRDPHRRREDAAPWRRGPAVAELSSRARYACAWPSVAAPAHHALRPPDLDLECEDRSAFAEPIAAAWSCLGRLPPWPAQSRKGRSYRICAERRHRALQLDLNPFEPVPALLTRRRGRDSRRRALSACPRQPFRDREGRADARAASDAARTVRRCAGGAWMGWARDRSLGVRRARPYPGADAVQAFVVGRIVAVGATRVRRDRRGELGAGGRSIPHAAHGGVRHVDGKHAGMVARGARSARGCSGRDVLPRRVSAHARQRRLRPACGVLLRAGLATEFTGRQINALIAPRPHLSIAGLADPLTPEAGPNRSTPRLVPLTPSPCARRVAQSVHPGGHEETPAMRKRLLRFLDPASPRRRAIAVHSAVRQAETARKTRVVSCTYPRPRRAPQGGRQCHNPMKNVRRCPLDILRSRGRVFHRSIPSPRPARESARAVPCSEGAAADRRRCT